MTEGHKIGTDRSKVPVKLNPNQIRKRGVSLEWCIGFPARFPSRDDEYVLAQDKAAKSWSTGPSTLLEHLVELYLTIA